jgi:hypothetical protein
VTTKRRALRVALIVALLCVQGGAALAQAPVALAIRARIERSSLDEFGSSPQIASYDLSADGKTVALLVVANANVGAPLWLLTEDVSAKQVISKIDLGASTFPLGGFALQVLFASDQQYLVVQDLQQIRVFDAHSLKLVRTIAGPSTQPSQPPLFVVVASRADVAVCAFGSPVPPEFGVHTTPTQLKVVEVSSGKLLGEWASDDLPQTISANGKMVAISSSRVQKGVLPLSVFDVEGNRLADFDGGFSFRKVSDTSKPLGRVRGLFVGDKEILLVPDENVDASGHPSGNSLQLVGITSKQIQETIKPQNFESAGEMVISGDQKTILVISWYIPAGIFRNQERVLPNSSSPELLVFEKGVAWRTVGSFSIPKSGLGLSGWLEGRRPRLSSDGSVIAIAQNGGITILTKSSSP